MTYDLADRPRYGGALYGSLEWHMSRWMLQLGGRWVALDLGRDTEVAMAKAMEIATARQPLQRVN